MGGNDAHVTAHNLNIAQLAFQSAVFVQLEAFGTDANEDLLIRNTGCIQHGSAADADLATLNFTLQHIDGRCA